jgi:hypothetical protein
VEQLISTCCGRPRRTASLASADNRCRNPASRRWPAAARHAPASEQRAGASDAGAPAQGALNPCPRGSHSTPPIWRAPVSCRTDTSADDKDCTSSCRRRSGCTTSTCGDFRDPCWHRTAVPDREHRDTADAGADDAEADRATRRRSPGVRVRLRRLLGPLLIAVEDVSEAEPGVAYPRCIGGRACRTARDCSGIWWLRRAATVLADPAPRRTSRAARMAGPGIGAAVRPPAAFDVGEVNEALAPFRTVLCRGSSLAPVGTTVCGVPVCPLWITAH